MAMSIRKNDQVIVRAGKDRGKKGRVLSVVPATNRVIVEGVNMVKRHTRPNPARPNAQVGVIEREGPVHVSNVALLDPKDRKATRVGTRRTEDGKRMRVTKRSGTEID